MARQIGDGSVIDIKGIAGDDREREIEALKQENKRLRRAVSDAEVVADRAREDADRALSALRRQLSPLYRALQAVFGELDAAGVTEGAAGPGAASAQPSSAPTVVDTRVAAVWASWKERLGPSCGRLIDALLVHSDLNTQQLAIAAGMSRQNVGNLIVKLNKAGLINKNGGRFSLKQL